jgi:hypothetical protein
MDTITFLIVLISVEAVASGSWHSKPIEFARLQRIAHAPCLPAARCPCAALSGSRSWRSNLVAIRGKADFGPSTAAVTAARRTALFQWRRPDPLTQKLPFDSLDDPKDRIVDQTFDVGPWRAGTGGSILVM